ncbi:hypothetical protein NFI96_008748, partial [Prochilodus magdalenae]
VANIADSSVFWTCRVLGRMEGEPGPEVVVTPALRRPEELEGTRPRRKKKKKKEIIYRSDAEDQDEGEGAVVTAEGEGPEGMDGALSTSPGEAAWDGPADGRYVTLTGTITRGKRKGELVEIRLTLTERELRDMARSKERLDEECDGPGPQHAICRLEAGRGPHVLLWSLSCSPFVFLLAFITSFYYGTLTWYNIFLVYNEERSFLHKVLVCPLLVLSYPLLMVLLCLGVAAYAAAAQVSWSIGAWWQAVGDLEKGVCGWACGKLGLEDCAPYSVVELLDSDTLSGTLQSRREETTRLFGTLLDCGDRCGQFRLFRPVLYGGSLKLCVRNDSTGYGYVSFALEHPHTVPADGAVGVEVEGHQAKLSILVLTTVPPHTDSLGVSTKTKAGLVTEDDPLPF